MDIGILNGKVYRNGEFVEENLYIKNGKVETITNAFLPCKKEYDANGKLVLPGFLDPHVHFHLTVGAHTTTDDFVTGSIHGALGGVTTYIDFLDPIKTVDQFEPAYVKRRTLAQQSVTDYGFHTTIANPTDEPATMLLAGKTRGIASLKLFTTYADSDRRTYDDYIKGLLNVSREVKSRIVIHAENDDLVATGEHILVKDHETSRPVLSETSEIRKLAGFARQSDGLLYIVHVSAGSSVELLHKEYAQELNHKNIIIESCPHYFLFNRDCYEREDGYLYTMTPPLRDEKERKLLQEGIADISVIATDHCPFDRLLKQAQYTKQISMGVGGIQYSFANMFTEFGPSIIPKFTEGPAKAYGLFPRKGTLLPGADADIVIYDDKVQEEIRDADSIYHQRRVTGRITQVFLRGKLIVEQGKFLGGNGNYVSRTLKV